MNQSRFELTTPCLSFQRVVIHSRFLGPLAQRKPSISLGDSAIPHIFGSRYPSAIFWRISSVVVNPVKLMVWRWARTHVRKESLEGCCPPLTNGNASPTVIVKATIVLVGATCTHRRPRKPLRTSIHSMFYCACRCDIAGKAPTRSNIAGAQA